MDTSINSVTKTLNPFRGNLKQHKIAVFDIETRNWTEFLILGFYDGTCYVTFNSIEKFLNYVIREKYKTYKIFAHYAGRFDFLFLLEHLGKRAEIVETNGKIIQLRVELDRWEYIKANGETGIKRHYIYFCDSFALLPKSQEKLAYAFQVKHKKYTDIDFNKINKVTKKLEKRLKNDCLGLYEILNRFQAELNILGAEMKLTIASTAMDLFRRKYLNISIPSHIQVEEQIRKSYYGGRVEVFQKYYHTKNSFAEMSGNTPLNYYDFNSLYPSVMSRNFFPVGNPVYFNRYRYNRTDVGFAELETVIPHNMYIPPLPFRQNDMLIYPTGHIKGFYPLPYLNMLEALKINYRINKVYLFEKADLFSQFVQDVYAERLKNSGTVKSYILKILANSLYGKFAQKRKRKKYIILPDQSDINNGVCNYNLDVDLWFQELDYDASHILPAISAYVTAYAQIKLFNAIYSVKDKIYYCDTDSLFTTHELPTSLNLGSLKLEDQIKEAIFINPKCYAYKTIDNQEVIKAKGFKTDKLNFNSFRKCLFENELSDFSQQFKKLYGFKSALKAKENENKSFVYRANYKKSLKSFDLKRQFNYFNSKPLQVK